MEEYREEIVMILKDAAIALIILTIVLSSLFIYTGRWPPMVVVESPSMSHGEGTPPISQYGVIDTGDIVAVKSVSYIDEIVTYVEGRGTGHRTYGQYGDVIIFRPDGSEDRTPVIHRPVLYLEFNETSGGFDVPTLSELQYGLDWNTSQGEIVNNLSETLYIYDYGHKDVTLSIELDKLLRYEHSGFITMGDNNIQNDEGRYDQRYLANINEPVKLEWIEGKARGELPWFGSIKLVYMGRTEHIPSNTWRNLAISIIILISLPIILEYFVDYYKNKYKEKKSESEDSKNSEKKRIKRME